jgi:predicted pyridoxine 5'-phosphate oxidase superfamily flavin-nucleotide-binding protein
MPGFVRVVGESEIAFPNYDGNGMYKSLGNVLVNPKVGLLFMRWTDGPRRIRVQGTASLRYDDPLLSEWEGAQLVVRVAAERIFLNCPRYLHRMELAEYSAYAPRAGHTPPVPDWKLRPEYREHLPAPDMAQLAAEGR